jgi:hypothetical protein
MLAAQCWHLDVYDDVAGGGGRGVVPTGRSFLCGMLAGAFPSCLFDR